MDLKKERIVLLLLAGINFTHIMDFMIMMPLASYLIELFKINSFQFSLLVSSYTLSAGISSFSASFIVDRFDRKKILLTGYAGFLIGTLGCALSTNYSMLLAARIFSGVFGGLIGAQVLSIVGDIVPFERRGRAMGTLMAAFSLASVLGVPGGLFLSKTFSWHAPFLVIVGIGLIIFSLVAFYLPSITSHLLPDDKKADRFNVLKTIAADKNQQRGLLFMVILMVGHFSIIPFIAQYMEFNVGFSKDQVTLIYLVGGIVSIFSAPLIGKLADRFGKFKLFVIFAILAVIPIFLITNMGAIPYYYVLIVTGFFFLTAGGRIIPAQAIITSVVKPQHRGGFMNINSALQQFSIAIASVITGLIVKNTSSGGTITLSELSDHQGPLMNYEYVGYLSIVFGLLSIFIGAKLKPVDTKAL